MLAAFLPLPLDPMLDTHEWDHSISKEDISNDYSRQFGPMDEARYESAKWWRKLNRLMSIVGILIIAAVVSPLEVVVGLSRYCQLTYTRLSWSWWASQRGGSHKKPLDCVVHFTPHTHHLPACLFSRLGIIRRFYNTRFTKFLISIMSSSALYFLLTCTLYTYFTIHTIMKEMDDLALYPLGI
jgi:hypothetical protein